MTCRSDRVLRGLGALAVLLVGLVGVPLALAALGGNPLPTAIYLGVPTRGPVRAATTAASCSGWSPWLVGSPGWSSRSRC